MLTLEEYEKSNRLMIAAHRGSSGKITENTLAAFDDAVNTGVKLIELDIQITADNKIIVYHDYIPPGFDKRISELNFDEIKDIQIGTNYGTALNSTHIPLLQEVIDLVKNKCYLMIEIKVTSGNKFHENVDKLIDLIIKNNYQKHTIFGSFNYNALKTIKNINSEIYTAAIKIPGEDRLPSVIKSEIGCDAFICSVDELNNQIEDDITKNHIFTGVYSVDTAESLFKVLQYNVRAIATDNPEYIINLLKSINRL
jgi:glycerophosphoryl diester phosphodiesterase